MTITRQALSVDGPVFSHLACGLWRLADWNLSPRETIEFIEGVLSLGITTFDLADIYGDYQCESLFGGVLGTRPELRDRLEIVTKCGIQLESSARPGNRLKHYDTSREHVLASVDQSLQLTRAGHIDLLLIHRPEPLLDPDELAETFRDLRNSGKVRHFGVSNFTPSQFELLASRLDGGLVTNQIEVSPLHLDPFLDGTLDQCLTRQIAPMAWSPFAQGALFDLENDRSVRVREALERVGRRHGIEFDQVVISWLLSHPARILPVLGTGKIERLRSAVEASSVRLDRQDWYEIWTASTGQPVP